MKSNSVTTQSFYRRQAIAMYTYSIRLLESQSEYMALDKVKQKIFLHSINQILRIAIEH